MNVIIRGMVLGGESDKNVGVRCADRSRVTVRKIDATVGQTYVVNNTLEFACWNLTSNRTLDLIAKVGGFLDGHSGGSAQMKLERAAVNAGEEVPAYPRNQKRERAKAAREESNQKSRPMLEANFQQAAIAAMEFLEGLFEALLKPYERIAAWRSRFVFLSPQQVLGHGRNDRPGKQVRSQHCEDHCFGERHEEIARDARQQEHRSKHNTDRKRRDERRCGDLGRAVEDHRI